MFLLNAQVDLYELFLPAINFVSDWLTIQVTFGVISFPLWAIFAFVLLVGIFARVIGSLAGIDFGLESDTVSHNIHVDGFH